MKFTVSRESTEQLSKVRTGVPRRSPSQAQKHVLIRAEGEMAIMRATDGDLFVETSADAEVQRAGECMVRAELLFDLLRWYPKGSEVTFDCKQRVLHVTANPDVEYRLITRGDDEDGSSLDLEALSEGMEPVCEVEGAELGEAILRAGKSTKKSRPVDWSDVVRIERMGSKVKIVGSDSHRLSHMTVSARKHREPDEQTWNLRSTHARKIRKLLTGHVEVGRDTKRLRLGGDGFRVYCSLRAVDDFPAWEDYLPVEDGKPQGSQARFDAEPLQLAIDRIKKYAQSQDYGNSQPVTFLDIEDGEAAIELQAGGAREFVDCEHDGVLEIGANLQYLKQALSLCDDRIYVNHKGGAAPIYITTPTRESWGQVIMPVERA